MSMTTPPSHPGLLQVEAGIGEFSSSLKAVKSFKSGEPICSLGKLTHVRSNSYNIIQIGDGPHDFAEMAGSDLIFTNHSCDPTTVFDLTSPRQEDWHVRAIKDIAPGDSITYFYPSTEWNMAQPFDCKCGSKDCLGRISGAAELSNEQLEGASLINPHIWRLARSRSSADVCGSVD